MGGRGKECARKEADVLAGFNAVSGKMSTSSRGPLMRNHLDEMGKRDAAGMEDRAPREVGGGGWVVGLELEWRAGRRCPHASRASGRRTAVEKGTGKSGCQALAIHVQGGHAAGSMLSAIPVG